MRTPGILLLLSLGLCSVAYADDASIYDQDGRRRGYVKQDPYSQDRFDIYDWDSKRTGYMQRDPYQPDRFNVYDRNGKRHGYVKGTRSVEK